MTATHTPVEQETYSPEDATSGLQRDIGRTGLLFAGVGSIIGSGWLS